MCAPLLSRTSAFALAVAFLALGAGCVHTTPPSEIAGRQSLGLATVEELDEFRLADWHDRSNELSDRDSIAWANDLCYAAAHARSEIECIELAQDCVTVASRAFASRPAKERLRKHAWLIEANAWERGGYPARGFLLRLEADLANTYLDSGQAQDDASTFFTEVEQLDAQARQRDAAANAATLAFAMSATSVAMAAASQAAVRSNGSSNQSSQNRAAVLRAQAVAAARTQAALQTAVATAVTVSRLNRDLDAAIVRQQSQVFSELSLQTPELSGLRTEFAMVVFSFLGQADEPRPMLERLNASILRGPRGWEPDALTRINMGLAQTCVDTEGCTWSDAMTPPLNLLGLLATRERRVLR